MKECPLCFSRNVEIVFPPLGMLNCCSCGFVYRDDVVSTDIYVNAPAYASAAVDAVVAAARRREAQKRAAIVAAHVAPGAKVLEIGSNEGALLEELRNLGIWAAGIEPDPAMVEFSRKKGLEVLQGTLEDNLARLAGGFDAVVMFHVLEHINQPVEALDMIHRSLKAGGRLIFEVPGFDSPMFSARRWHASWAIKEHLSYFTSGTVRALLARTGFEPILLTRRNWDAEYETFRNNFLRLPGVSLLYRAYRRVKERFEPFQSRTAVLAERPAEKRERATGCAALAATLVEVLKRGDALLAVAEKREGLPPRGRVGMRDVYESVQTLVLLTAALLFYPFTRLRKGGNGILVIPTSKLGDLTAQIPFFKALRANFPDRRIAALMFNPGLACLLDGLVDEVIISKGLSLAELLRVSCRVSRCGFSKAYLLPWGGRMDFLAYFSGIPERFAIYSGVVPFASWAPRLLLSTRRAEFARGDSSTSRYLDLLGGTARGAFTREVAIRTEWAESMRDALGKVRPEGGKLAGVVVGCGNKLKLWAPEKLAQVSDWLHDQGYGVLLIGSAADSGFAAEVMAQSRNELTDTTGLFSLEELAPFFKELNLVVGVDTGPLYLASAMGVRVADISGPCEPREQLAGDNTLAIRPNAGCAPCSYVMATETRCRFGTRRCLMGLDASAVTEALAAFV